MKIGKIITLIIIGANIGIVLVLYWLALREGDPFTSKELPLLITMGTLVGAIILLWNIFYKVFRINGVFSIILALISIAIIFFTLGMKNVLVPAIIYLILCVLCIIGCIIGLIRKD